MPRLTKRCARLCAVLFLACFSLAVSGPRAEAPEAELTPRWLGAEDAPVTIIEFSSLTCSHCATFHTDTLPRIKEAYIDSGKVRLAFHDFPLDTLALGASMLTRCVPAERYHEFLDTLFREQQAWARSSDPVEALGALAGDVDLPPDGVRTCLSDGKLMVAIRTAALAAQNDHGIRSTPTFLVNGRKITGAQPFEAFRDMIEAELKAAAAAAGGPGAVPPRSAPAM